MNVAVFGNDSTSRPFGMASSFTRPPTLTLNVVLFTNLINQLCRYARVQSLLKVFGNPLLRLPFGNPLTNFINRVIYPVMVWHTSPIFVMRE